MTTTPQSIIDEAETLVRSLADTLTRPRRGECLCCYVLRMLEEYGCANTHRHALRYRDAMAPRATALHDRLSRLGACCCDCELFLNGYLPRAALTAPDPDLVEIAPCARVRRGSVQPCANWVRRRRW